MRSWLLIASLALVGCGGEPSDSAPSVGGLPDGSSGIGGAAAGAGGAGTGAGGAGMGGAGTGGTGMGGAGMGGALIDGSVPDAAASSGKWAMGYYEAYNASRYPVSAIEWSGLTEIAVSFYAPRADGSIDQSTYLGGSGGKNVAASVVLAAHAHGVKAIAALGGSDSQSKFVAATAASVRDVFAANIVKLASDNSFDGIDFDWEPFDVADRPVLLDVIGKVRAGAPGLILTATTGYINMNMNDDLSGLPEIARAVDQFDMMSYGAAGAWSGWKSWHSDALYHQDSATPTSIDSTVQAYVAAGVPKAKLGVGIGFFGLCYTPPVTGPDQDLAGSTIVASDGVMSYVAIMQSYYSADARKWDSLARVPYLSFSAATGPKGCGYISYDDDQSIEEKGSYVKDQGLGGVIMWEINEGYDSSATASPLLVSVGRHVIH